MKTMIALFLLAIESFAQNPPTVREYRLDFVVKELEDSKTINSRTYSTTFTFSKVSVGCIIRTGSKVPIRNLQGDATYTDVGVNIDCNTMNLDAVSEMETQGRLGLTINAEISSVVSPEGSSAPVIRQSRWRSNAIVPIKKQTVLFVADDPSSRRRTQLEVTATPLF